MSTKKTEFPSGWSAELLRLTVFPRPDFEVRDVGWWKDIVSEPPTTRTEQPKIGQITEEGNWEQRNLVLGSAPFRIDWITTIDLAEGSANPESYAWEIIVPKFHELMNRWLGLDTAPLPVRLAFGAVLAYPVKNKEEGYSSLMKFLPFKLDPIGSSDFTYQINRPRPALSVPGLRLNRLSKWLVRNRLVTAVVPGSEHMTRTPSLKRSDVCLELDINTAQEFEGELSREQTKAIFSELIELAEEIAAKGDVA